MLRMPDAVPALLTLHFRRRQTKDGGCPSGPLGEKCMTAKSYARPMGELTLGQGARNVSKTSPEK